MFYVHSKTCSADSMPAMAACETRLLLSCTQRTASESTTATWQAAKQEEDAATTVTHGTTASCIFKPERKKSFSFGRCHAASTGHQQTYCSSPPLLCICTLHPSVNLPSTKHKIHIFTWMSPSLSSHALRLPSQLDPLACGPFETHARNPQRRASLSVIAISICSSWSDKTSDSCCILYCGLSSSAQLHVGSSSCLVPFVSTVIELGRRMPPCVVIWQDLAPQRSHIQ